MSKGAKLTFKQLMLYKRLCKRDLADKDLETSWKYVPVLVASNRERVDVARHKATLFASDTGSYLFRWHCDIKDWKNHPILMQERLDVQDADSCFWQYFVHDADAFLTANLNNNLALANGTPTRLHSLTFSTSDQLRDVQSQMATLPPGSVITLDSPPLSVNMKVHRGLDGNQHVSEVKAAQFRLLQKLSISKDDIIIPVPVMRNITKPHTYTVQQPTSGIARVTTQDVFPYELAFAMTIHKAQGRTIPRVVLALSNREYHYNQMNYAQIYVALSRVKHSNDIRMLYNNTGSRTGLHGIQYITHLKHDIHVLDYYAGFVDPTRGELWDPQHSLIFRGSRQQSRAA